MGHFVYKYVLDDEIIYIGKTDINLHNRLACHGKPGDNIDKDGWDEIKKGDIYYLELANSTMTDVVESELIRRYKPKYNKAKIDSEWCGLPFTEPEWIKYEPPKKKNKKFKLQEEILLNTVKSKRPTSNPYTRDMPHIYSVELTVKQNKESEPILKDILSKLEEHLHMFPEKTIGTSINLGVLSKKQQNELLIASEQNVYTLKGSFVSWCIPYSLIQKATDREGIYITSLESNLSIKKLIEEIQTALCASKCMEEYFQKIHDGDSDACLACINCKTKCFIQPFCKTFP